MKPKPRLPLEEIEAMWPKGSSVFWKPVEHRTKIRYGNLVRGVVYGYEKTKSLVKIKITCGRNLDVHPDVLEAR